MAHRPYPSRDRARKQLDRHCYELGPAPRRVLRHFQPQLLNGTAAVVHRDVEPMAATLEPGAPPVDEYRLTTR
ncbi:hypothetical protein GQF42_00415 [Streptomyces broussonetiae]|uniref:Uncharacterized protein n=1 Tax=Streptomyces broussonetiae TaxID=2686304 RepID=A0A6I6MXZ6_9ACTN|nr:hypothetical protein [Streptomyces broussonetiae]QHA02037.1 hypothetical protein GQF42_00415 [Streptomyces broussonetiae]